MGFVQIDGKDFTKDGQNLQFRGLNLGNWMLVEHYMIGLPWTEYQMRAIMRRELGEERFRAFWDTFMDVSLTEADFEFMRECGFNWVQLPINYRHFLNDGTASGFDQRGFEYVDRVVEWCRQYDMTVLISLHAAPGAQVRDWNAESAFGEAGLWDHEHFMAQTERFWEMLAARYRDETAVMGYEILNEPVAQDLDAFNAFNRRMLRAIRSQDSNHVVGIAFNEWNKDFSSLAPDLFDDPQVTGIFHHYLMQYHPFGKMEEYPGVYEGKFYGPDELLAPLQASVDHFPHARPLICGEFGVARWADSVPAAQLAMKEDFLKFLESRGISWTAWAYKDLGVLGLVRPSDDTPWMRFQNRPDVKQLKTPSYRKAFQAYWEALQEEIPDLKSEERDIFSTQTKHVYDAVMLPRFVEMLKAYSAEELRAMAKSFAFENCTPVQERVDLFKHYTKP